MSNNNWALIFTFGVMLFFVVLYVLECRRVSQLEKEQELHSATIRRMSEEHCDELRKVTDRLKTYRRQCVTLQVSLERSKGWTELWQRKYVAHMHKIKEPKQDGWWLVQFPSVVDLKVVLVNHKEDYFKHFNGDGIKYSLTQNMFTRVKYLGETL